jgi:hypothetical protein
MSPKLVTLPPTFDLLVSQLKTPKTPLPTLCFRPLGLFNQASAWLNLVYPLSTHRPLWSSKTKLLALLL